MIYYPQQALLIYTYMWYKSFMKNCFQIIFRDIVNKIYIPKHDYIIYNRYNL